MSFNAVTSSWVYDGKAYGWKPMRSDDHSLFTIAPDVKYSSVA